MSLERTISPILSNLIAEVQFTIKEQDTTLREKLLAVYNQAKSEGYTKDEIGQLIKEKIPQVSDRTIRRSLPEDAKYTEKRNKSEDSDDADNGRIPDGIVIPSENRDRSEENTINITDTYEVKETETEEKSPFQTADQILESEQTQQQEQNEYINKSELETLRQQNGELRETIETITKQKDKLELEKEKLEIALNKVYSGSDIFEVKDKQIPLKWQFVILPKEKMVFDLDIPRARKMGI